MKALKKLSCFALILVLILAMAAPALAADVTINLPTPSGNTAEDVKENYKAYKIFDADVAGEDPNKPITDPTGTGSEFDHVAYSIKDNSPFYTTIAGFPGITLTPIKEETVDEKTVKTFNVEVTAAFSAANLAAALQTLVNTEAFADVEPAATGTATLDVGANLNLSDGYFLIVGDLGSKAILDTVGQEDVTITTKNDLPTIEKTTPEIEGLKIGSKVDYTITVHAKPGATKYVVHDTMGTGLTFNNDVAITGLTLNSDYTVEKAEDGCAFHVVFTQAYLNTITEAKDIEIKYSATINSNATVEVDTTTNKAKLDYGENGHTEETDNTKTETPLYAFDLAKTRNNNAMLPGAKFELRDANDNVIPLVATADGYRPAITSGALADPETSRVLDFVTTTDKITFTGFGAGTYQLVELEAPDGYNKVEAPITVSIEQKMNAEGEPEMDGTGNPVMILKVNGTDSKLTADITPAAPAGGETPATPATWTEGGVHVVNFTGAELPSTGGIGTTIFYIVGGLLVVGACVLLVTRKRADAE